MASRAYAPNARGERATCIAAVARIAADGVAPALANLVRKRYEPVLAAYEAARATNDAAAVALARAIDDKALADAAWATALNRWLASAYALEDEKAVRAELKPLMRNLAPALFVRLGVRTRLELMPALDLFARGRPELTGDLELLDALRDATAVLEEKTTAAELADADRSQTSKAVLAATAAFDRCYGALVRAVRTFDPDGAGELFPRFHRSAPAARTREPVPEISAVLPPDLDPPLAPDAADGPSPAEGDRDPVDGRDRAADRPRPPAAGYAPFMADLSARPEDDVLRFWFDEGPPALADRLRRWFQGGPALDAEVQARFGPTVEAALRGELDAWAAAPRGRLALVLVFDQLTRNVLRGDPRTFSGDPVALRLATEAFDQGLDRGLAWIERLFLSMPMMHSEDVGAHRRLDEIARRLQADAPAEYAPMMAMHLEQNAKYTAILERFGRFPHRNEVLGRPSTPEEREFLVDWAQRAPPTGMKR